MRPRIWSPYGAPVPTTWTNSAIPCRSRCGDRVGPWNRSRGSSIARLDPAEVLKYLTHTHTVRKVRGRYVLSRRWVMLRGVSGAAHSHAIRVLVGKLRTVEHNLVADSDAHSWFDFTTENARFPVSQLEALDQLLRRSGLGWMRKLDLFMRHCEANRRPTEPTVWLGVGMHRFQHNTSAVFASPAAREGKARRSAKRRK